LILRDTLPLLPRLFSLRHFIRLATFTPVYFDILLPFTLRDAAAFCYVYTAAAFDATFISIDIAAIFLDASALLLIISVDSVFRATRCRFAFYDV